MPPPCQSAVGATPSDVAYIYATGRCRDQHCQVSVFDLTDRLACGDRHVIEKEMVAIQTP
ncbi:protein of unknown function [Rhodovastum atsumiense]|nr:protein of unknown function [Rhodovastum atsumiense]